MGSAAPTCGLGSALACDCLRLRPLQRGLSRCTAGGGIHSREHGHHLSSPGLCTHEDFCGLLFLWKVSSLIRSSFITLASPHSSIPSYPRQFPRREPVESVSEKHCGFVSCGLCFSFSFGTQRKQSMKRKKSCFLFPSVDTFSTFNKDFFEEGMLRMTS